MSDKFELAYKEFHDKTEWIQDEMNKGVVKAPYWGLHRADAIKALVDSLREEIKKKMKSLQAIAALLEMFFLQNNI